MSEREIEDAWASVRDGGGGAGGGTGVRKNKRCE